MADRKLLLLVAGYAIALTWGAVELRHTSPLPAEPDDVDTQPIAPIAVQPDNVINISAFDEIVDRPLFVAGRRPINEAGTEVAEVIESDADAETRNPGWRSIHRFDRGYRRQHHGAAQWRPDRRLADRVHCQRPPDSGRRRST